MTDRAKYLQQLINEITSLFGPEAQVTLLVRNPDAPERNCVLSDESDIEVAINSLRAIKRNGRFGIVRDESVRDAVHKAVGN